MAVAVPEGTHTIMLGYDDPWIGYGLLGSGLALVVLLGPALVLRRRRTPAADGVAESVGHADADRPPVEAP